MSLTLRIIGLDRLPNGEPATMRLDRHGLTIGRSSHADWSLPDPQHYVSSSHCEIRYRDGAYTLMDTSTNGTFVNGAGTRLGGPHVIADGDVFAVGEYQIRASLGGAAQEAAAAEAAAAAQKPFDWGAPPPAPSAGPASGWSTPQDPPASSSGWGSPPAGNSWGASPAPAAPAPTADPDGWGSPPAQAPQNGWGSAPAPSADSGWGAASAPASSGGWGSAPSSAPSAPGSSGISAWDAPPAPATPPSAWSGTEPDRPVAAGAADIWSQMADLNKVDWDRGGFDRPQSRNAAAEPSSSTPSDWGPGDTAAWAAPAVGGAPAPPAPAPQPTSPAAPSTDASAGWRAFVEAAGLGPGDFKAPPDQVQAGAGALLRRLIGGLVVLMEARARAKSQMGAQATMLEFDGNNPLKFARSPERALAQLLNPTERGFMPADRAVEDAFQDLQAHQMATLAAMQGALNATLARFSPEAIRTRAETRGLLAKILPATRDAALWQAYEREFEGVARGSDEAFMDVFAKEFRAAYERASLEMKAKR